MVVEFTNEQLDYVNSSIEDNVFLEACPGSGKTEVVAAKVAKEINSWKNHPGGLAALSFANSATAELTSRLSKYLPHGRGMFPHFLGTFDSFIYKNIVSPLSTELTTYVGEDGDSSIRIIESTTYIGYRTKYKYANRGPVAANHYSLDLKKDKLIFDTGDSVLDNTLGALKLNDWQTKDFIQTKARMMQGGFATYRDIECLALTALTNVKYHDFAKLLVRRYPLIIIDECQDLSEEQLTILQAFADNGAKLHFIGDLHQAIYGFRDVEPVKVKNFVKNNNFTSFQLTRNFRSCQNIVELCAKLTGRSNIVGNMTWLKPRCLVLQYKSCPTELIDNFEEECDGLNNTVVVSRGHSILNKFKTTLDKPNNIQKLAIAINLFNQKDIEALKQSLFIFSEFLLYHLKETCKPNSFNCPLSISSNLSWRNFLYDSLKYLIENDLQNINIQWSRWVKVAKELIRALPKQRFCSGSVASILNPLECINLVSPPNSAKVEVASSLGVTSKSLFKYKKITIHGAKGETHDATIVISSARSGGDSHWKDWLNDPDKEAARFAYVASSRPRELLIWAVKTLTPPERDKLESIGFTIV